MKNNVFSYENFIAIEDEDYLYIFRALEDGDYFDIRHGNVKLENQKYSSLRTYRERFNAKNVEQSRYTENDKVSLAEMYDHIKKNFYQGTNCISFSTNANVTLDYANVENEFAMIRVPKSEMKNIYFAGEYMLSELDKIISKQLESVSNVEIRNVINEINNLDSEKEIVKATLKHIKRDLEDSTYLRKRFINKVFFNPEQQLEYARTVAKLTVLESHGYMKKIVKNSNSSLLATIGMAFSSSEVIHYNDNFAYPIEKIDRIIVEMFAILEQASTIDIDKNLLNELKNIIIKSSNMELDILNKKFGNIDISDLNALYTLFEYKKIDIEEMFTMTKGSVDFDKFQTSLEYVYNFAVCKKKTYELGRLLKRIVNDDKYDNLIDNIIENTIAINSKIINRRNGEGKQICETVNLSANSDVLNNKLFSKDEDAKLISYLMSLNEQEIDNIIHNNAVNVKDYLLNNILVKNDNVDINTFYAKYILNNLNLKMIYRSEYVSRTFDENDLSNFIANFKDVNFPRLYNSFKSYGLNDEDISYYIISFLINGGYKDYTATEISNMDNIDDFTLELKNVIVDKISSIRLDRLFNIIDNGTKIENTNIVLRDYQDNAVKRLRKIYETKNYGGVILPTGAGKSFVALSVMLEHKNEKILYYAPRYEILHQFQEHICNYVLKKEVISDYEYDKLLNSHQSVDDYIKESEVESEIKTIFPYFDVRCYQGLQDEEDVEDNTDNIGLLILDEVHRTGGQKWNNRIKNVMAKNKDAKVLAITATPIRDVDQENMILNLAKESGTYSDDELIERKYIASEMYLRDAMQQDIVVTPNIVSFDYSLGSSDEFKEIKKMYESEEDPTRKKELEKTYHDMRDICEESKKIGLSKIIKDAFIKNNKPLNGRYIVFLPHNNTNLSSEDYFQKKISEVKEYFKDVDIEPEIDYLSSNRDDDAKNRAAISNFKKDSNHLKLLLAIDMLNEGVHIKGIDGVVMLRKLSSDTKILYLQQIGRCIYSLDPENKLIPEEKRPIIFDVFNNYLEQNLDHEFNKRGVTSDYEKLLSIISWSINHKRLPDVNSDNISEARMAITLRNIKIKYEKYLGINFFSSNLTETEIFEIKSIMELGEYIDLWNTFIPERIIPPGEPEIDKVKMCNLTANQKRFIELYKEATKKNNNTKGSVNKKIIETLNILDLLSEYGFDINPETLKSDVLLKDVLSSLSIDIKKLLVESIEVDEDYEIGKNYRKVREEYYKRNKIFENYSVLDLRNMGIFYFDDLNISCINEDGFITRGPSKHLRLNINTGTYYNKDGFDINGKDRLNFTKNDSFLNEFNFDRDGYYYEEIDGQWVNTMSKLDKHNFDYEGYYHEIDENGNDKIIDKVNRHGFDQEGFYNSFDEKTKSYVKTKLKISPNGFDIDGFYCVKDFKYDPNQHRDYILVENEKHFIYYHYSKNSDHYITNIKFNENGFDMDGFYWDYDENGEKVKTDRKINNQGFDCHGYYYKLVDGVYVNTNDKVDENGFDLEGNYYEKTSDGKYQKQNSKVDKKGFDKRGLKIITYVNDVSNDNEYAAFDKDGFAYDKVGHIFVKIKPETKYNSQGFNIDGKCLNEKGELVDYNKYGFDQNGNNIFTKKIYDKNGFGFLGKSLIKNSLGKLYNPYGFDRDGFYWKPIGKKKDKVIREKTNSLIDKRGFDITHTYCPINPITGKRERKNGLLVDEYGFAHNRLYLELNPKNGKYEGVNKKYPNVNRRQFSADGYFWKGNFYTFLEKTERKYDERGFDIHKRYIKDYTGDLKDAPLYDKYGFDLEGFYWELDDKTGKRIKTDRRLDDRGFDCNGMHGKDFFDEYNFDRDGNYISIDVHHTFYKTMYYKKPTNPDGFDYRHIYVKTGNLYNEEGFDIDGFYWKLNKDGTRTKTDKKFNDDGMDMLGKFYITDIQKEINPRLSDMSHDYDFYGFQHGQVSYPYGKSKIFNYRGFTRDGYYCEPIDEGEKFPCSYSKDESKIEYITLYKNRIKTDKKYDPNGFDIDGFYWKLNEDGTRTKTSSRYDANGYDIYGFNQKGINRDTGTKYDKYYFDKDGINMFTGTYKDVLGYNQDRINSEFSMFSTTCIINSDENKYQRISFEGYDINGKYVGVNYYPMKDMNITWLRQTILVTKDFMSVGSTILMNIKNGNFKNFIGSSGLAPKEIYDIISYCMTVDKEFYKEFAEALICAVETVKRYKKEIAELEDIYKTLTKEQKMEYDKKEKYIKQNGDVSKTFKGFGRKL